MTKPDNYATSITLNFVNTNPPYRANPSDFSELFLQTDFLSAHIFRMFYFVYLVDILVNLCSLITNLALFVTTIRDDNIKARVKLIVLMFVVCDLTTSLTYLAVVCEKMNLGDKLVYPSTARGGGLINWTLFVHEAAFFMFAMNVFIVSAERLISCKFEIFTLKHKPLVDLLTVFVLIGTIFFSFFMSHLQHIDGVRGPPAVTMNVLQLLGVFILNITMRISRKRYQKGLGDNLDLRFESAQNFYFNRALFYYLSGSVVCRFFAFSGIVILILFPVSEEAFGWLSFFYHNINALSNSIFPWIIMLRNKRLSKWICYIQHAHSSSVKINDLAGKPLQTQSTGEDYFRMLQQSW